VPLSPQRRLDVVDQCKPCIGGTRVLACAELGGRNEVVPVNFKEKAFGYALLDQLTNGFEEGNGSEVFSHRHVIPVWFGDYHDEHPSPCLWVVPECDARVSEVGDVVLREGPCFPDNGPGYP
jgi:hypothetical protein